MLRVDQLTKRFGPVAAVRGLSFQVRPGEVVGLLGPNGSGKTTTLRMIAGLLAPSSGQVEVDGIDVARDPVATRRRIGFMTSTTGLYERLTAREMLAIFGALHGMSPQALADRIDQLSRELDLSAILDRRCGALSSGQKQRVSIARAVIHAPKALVLDEPTATLDPLASEAILDLVRSSGSQGRAVLLSTHRMEEAQFLCQRIVFLQEGRVVAEGSPATLIAQSGEASLTGAFLHYAKAKATVSP